MPVAMSEHVIVVDEGPVRSVRMNRPDKKNALTVAMYRALADAIDSAKASFATVLPVPSANAQSDQTQLTARDIQLKDPTRLGAAATNRAGGPQPQTQIAMASPSREEISSAYQSALQRAPTAPPPPAAGPQPVTALSPAAAPVAVAPPAAAPQQQQFARTEQLGVLL